MVAKLNRSRARRNTCAQHAASRILGIPAPQLIATHPPDTPLRLLGTTPWRLARLLTDHGRPSRVLTRATRADVRPGALACVDLRPRRGGVPRLHWVEVLAVDEAGVTVRAPSATYAWDEFLRAWSCRASPFAMHRRALVVLA